MKTPQELPETGIFISEFFAEAEQSKKANDKIF